MEKCDHCGEDMVETLKAEVILDSPNGDEVYVDIHATEKGVFIRVQSDEDISHDVPSRNYERWETTPMAELNAYQARGLAKALIEVADYHDAEKGDPDAA